MSTWLPLPTHDGPWIIEYQGRQKAINVTMDFDGPHCDEDDDVLLTESGDVRYWRIPLPDEKLPRMFRWKSTPDFCGAYGVLWPNNKITLLGDDGNESTVIADQFLESVSNSFEIEWID